MSNSECVCPKWKDKEFRNEVYVKMCEFCMGNNRNQLEWNLKLTMAEIDEKSMWNKKMVAIKERIKAVQQKEKVS